MSRTEITESRPKCDQCGKLGSYGQMMPWPHSGWVTVRVSQGTHVTLDFCSVAHAIAYLRA